MNTLMLLTLLAAGPEIAAPKPEPYRVVGVEPWDTLSIRSKPSARGALLGALPPDAVGVTLLKLGVEGKWAYIRYHGVTGWVSASFLSPAAAAETPAKGMVCGGTEPFWSFTLAGAETRFQSPEGDLAAPLTGPVAASNRTTGWLLSGDGEVRVAVITEDAGCSDGMSENSWDFAAWVVLSDGSLVQGCCRAR